MKAPTNASTNLKENCCPRQSNMETLGPAWAPLPGALGRASTGPIDGMNGGEFLHANAYVWALAHVVLRPSFKVRMWRHPAIQGRTNVVMWMDGTPEFPPPFPVMKFISRGKTAVRVQANWD